MNTAINAALGYNTTGNRNNALGYGAINNQTSGNDNTGIGSYALLSNTTGSNNTALGNITEYDTAVFANVSINASGVMTYDVLAGATACSYINIVFVLK